ncbi:o-succinylbenzoate synthase [Photobacterium damselae]|uniref:o-succinylbenzoate synthase n=1 Tax=Photobacterium damselae TaxID=38293 RepID=UPI00083A0681|nr:o-succinylbenzoate synthase [Photobacterium damselae]AWK81364.1 o-succinylbenzoate synthase [Photobacterium damselae]KAB1182265.1 o-succinylbenzoate synthase [Photobacterium damselae subsp. damselae]MBF7100737.1 o-succinylbenzoate synthase [Photobacterium damselae]QSH58051.1 o-succinylbenzoate synthase [Photobacterium damselae subsp. damselae]UKA02590.1 o-succinylbenzoate synthase [Photobacterium damselae subsp. damselae]
MRSAKLYQYQLPMDSGVILRNQRLVTRDGFIVELKEGDRCGFGEIAPLPEFSHETLEQAQQQAEALIEQWVETGDEDLNAVSPSVAFGFSMAQLELSQALPVEGNYQVAPLCSGDPDDLVVRLNQMSGDKVAKIKVGLYEAVRDGIVANMFLESIPELKLRLDANRQWTPLKAQQFAKYVKPELRAGIAFLEEPCRNPADSLAFAQETGINIAWDETVRDDGFEVKAEPGVAAIIIKPTLVGSIDKCRQLVEQAHQQGLTAVISSSLESSLGLNQLARVAQWLTPGVIPGLDTMQLFAEQLETPWPESNLPVKALSELEIICQK